MITANYIELAITATAFGILFGYQALRLVRFRRHPLSTSLGANNRTRAIWVDFVIDEGRDVLAIQTLRNWTMAATFLASTAILIGLAFLNFAVTIEPLSEIAHMTNFFGSESPALLLTKVLTVVVLHMFTFINFTLAVRYYNHVGFMINLPTSRKDAGHRRSVRDTVNRGATHYNLGMNGFYTSIPTTLWLLGPVWLLVSAVAITVYRLDRAEGTA